eukprot:7426659-Pyramimonas_sp.AAC.1
MELNCWTQGEKRRRVSGVLCASLPLYWHRRTHAAHRQHELAPRVPRVELLRTDHETARQAGEFNARQAGEFNARQVNSTAESREPPTWSAHAP